jgi:D-alanine-D-alanine ligase
MPPKIRVVVLFGGRSAEHEVSLLSARNIVEALDRSKYDVRLVGIDKEGRWHPGDASALLAAGSSTLGRLAAAAEGTLALLPGGGRDPIVPAEGGQALGGIDVVFPALHGPFGEDGTVQGLLKLAGLPFVGPSVLGSAVAMDKDVAKRLMRDAGIPTPRFLAFDRIEPSAVDFDRVKDVLGLPVFVKPANLGSSVGIHKASGRGELMEAVADAFRFDSKILLEEAVAGREIECSVLGNADPIASVPGEVKPNDEFYTYQAKYVDENGAALEIPARLSSETTRRVQELAVRTFRALACEGMARVDFFLRPNGELLVNELNTIPGFTSISMYPKLWEASGIPYAELLDRLIQLALERFRREQGLKTSYEA